MSPRGWWSENQIVLLKKQPKGDTCYGILEAVSASCQELMREGDLEIFLGGSFAQRGGRGGEQAREEERILQREEAFLRVSRLVTGSLRRRRGTRGAIRGLSRELLEQDQ